MARALFRLAFLFLILWLPTEAAEHGVDWAKVAPETLEHYTALLRLDTSNPPGNETRAAEYVKGVLEREGVAAKLFALEPARANLVARLKGNGSRKPILIMGHTDVVGVQREKWSVDPFAAVRRNGFIYGRGAQDDKDNLTACLMVMLLLKRSGVKLDRDVIFLAEAGEEGTTKFGIDFMVERHWNEIAAEYALAEGGGAISRDGKVRYVRVSTSEKVPRQVRLVARGTAGHGSRPTPDNAVVHLATAVAKVGAWQPPIRLNETTRAFFERLASISGPEDAARYRAVLDPAQAAEADKYFSEHDLSAYTTVRTSIAPTVMQAGFRNNVIPSEGMAFLDIRALPDEDLDRLYTKIGSLINDPSVQLVPFHDTDRPATAPSRMDTAMFQALEAAQRRVYPGVITVPAMLAGATDMAQLRAKGVQAYGVGPAVEESGEGGAHSDDERLSEKSLGDFVQYLWYTVLESAASK